MKKSRRYSRGVIGLPSLFISAGWIALWLVWPSAGRVVSPARIPASSRVFFARLGFGSEGLADVLPFANHIRTAPVLRDGDDEPAGSLFQRRVFHPKYLERRVEVRAGAVPDKLYSSLVLSGPGVYRPHRRDERVFSREAGGTMKVVVTPAGELGKYGFQVPEAPIAEIKRKDKPWMITAYVEIGDYGRPEHVFLERGCDDGEVNAMVVRAIYMGRLTETGAGCAGRVTVSFGRQ